MHTLLNEKEQRWEQAAHAPRVTSRLGDPDCHPAILLKAYEGP